MCSSLYRHPTVLGLLRHAKETPEDGTPRLVLADWLDDHGDPDRAEFIRLGCSHDRDDAVRVRHDELLAENGGGWLGPLWQWPNWPTSWHRGLLTASLPRRLDPSLILSVVPWVDTLFVHVPSSRFLSRLAAFLADAAFNHLHIDLRPPLREAGLLALLEALPESPFLRSLTIDWPLGSQRHEEGEPARPSASPAFFEQLMGVLPVGRHLTHLASWPPLDGEQAAAVRQHGVVSQAADHTLWMHGCKPEAFRARR